MSDNMLKKPVTVKSYKTINQVVINRTLTASYLLTNLYVQNPSELADDILIGVLSLQGIVNNGVLQYAAPTLTLTDAFQQTGDKAYVSYDGQSVGSTDNSTLPLLAPLTPDTLGFDLTPNNRYYFGKNMFYTEPNVVDIKYSHDYVIFNDLTITKQDCSLMLKCNIRVDNKGGVITLLYQGDSIINNTIVNE